jgi:DNA-directed RNA polymerase subunit E'/Rpb7
MDPLFERRQLTKKIHIKSRFLQKNIQTSLLSQLKLTYEGKCLTEGYIQNESITILNYSLGRVNYIKGGVDYDVTFQADICMPHTGQRFKAPVTLKSKVGIHAKTPPIEVLIPRDLHIGNEDFENIKIEDEIEFEVIGSQYKQGDENIVVVGRLVSKVQLPVEMPLNVAEPAESKLPENVPKSESGEEMNITIKTSDEKPKKRRLKKNETANTNEQLPAFQEGMVKG